MGAQDTGSLFRPPRGLRPQLGVGAVNRAPSAAAKNRMVQTGHPKSPLTFSQPMQAVNPTTQTPQEPQGKTMTMVYFARQNESKDLALIQVTQILSSKIECFTCHTCVSSVETHAKVVIETFFD